MIETHFPEVNVDELMERIREEVRRRKAIANGSLPPVGQPVRKGTQLATPNPILSLSIPCLDLLHLFGKKTDIISMTFSSTMIGNL